MIDQFRTEDELKSSPPNSGHRERFLDRLEKENQEKGNIRWMPWLLSISAVAAMLWGISTITVSTTDTIPYYNPAEALNERMNQLEFIYTQHIETKIPTILEKQPELKEQVALLDQLEVEYEKLKKLLIQSAGNESITKEMINNHRLRLKIMQQLLDQLELIKSKKSDKNEIKSA